MNLATTYLFLAGAILAEVVGTTALAASDGLSKLIPSIVSVVSFVAVFWLLSFPLRCMPSGPG
jgi:small multidrug resistance pump